MITSLLGVPSGAQPWGRGVNQRLDTAEKSLADLTTQVNGVPGADKTVYAEFANGQNVALGVSGRVDPSVPTSVHYISSTGLFEVTISLAGLVRDGAILGAGYDSPIAPYTIYFDIPQFGVVGKGPLGDSAWTPFASSYSTVFSVRPGPQDFALYFYSVCTAGANSAAYIKRSRISVKPV